MIDYPPFPPLTWDHYFWVAKATLPSWAGFSVQYGEEGVHDAMTSEGRTRLSISPTDSATRIHPTPEQVSAFRYLLDNEAAIADAVVYALVEYCPGHAYHGDDEVLLGVSAPGDLRRLIRLSGVHVLDVARDGVACVGFEFDCAWDAEHGAGVMTHKSSIVATGQADCSFTAWIARQGLERRKS